MTLVVGADEAGYGPNLGPLVVGATAWRVAVEPGRAEEALAAAVAGLAGPHGRALWADSKDVHRGSGGFAALELGALVGAALVAKGPVAGWPDLAATCGAGGAGCDAPEQAPLARLALPRQAAAGDVAALAAATRARLAAGGVALVAVRARLVWPAAFNRALAGGLNKSDLLSATTLDLAATLRDEAADEPALVWCDRHGGRRRYAPLVSRHFDAPLVQVLEETPARSAYAAPARRARVEFSVGGEARTPVALASMTAKYLRELAMLAFNEFWQARAPGVESTAGYPLDAVRWRREAAAAVEREGCGWDAVWRRA